MLLISGDIQLNPGPSFPCKVCTKNVIQKHQILFCKSCNFWVHKKCSELSNSEYLNFKNTAPCPDFLCKTCKNDIGEITFRELPFSFEDITESNTNEAETSFSQENDISYDCFKQRGLHFLHLNINSVLTKIDQVRIIAQKTNVAVFGLSESKIDNSVPDNEINIPGYKVLRADRNKHGGGVLCYIRDDITYNRRENFSKDTENIFVDILLPKTKPILIGIIYRPPDQVGFIRFLSDAISNAQNFENQEVYILGDININLIPHGRLIPNGVRAYREFCSLHGLTQIIKDPTRITENTSTLLDHILTNSCEKVSQFGVLDIGLSDHQMIFCTRKILKLKTGMKTFIDVRSWKNYNQEILNQKLSEIDYPDYSQFEDINIAYADFIEKTMEVIDKIAPMKKVCIRNNSEEWIDGEILDGIRNRDKLFKKFKKTRSHADHLNFKKIRNHLQELIKKKKRNYVEYKLNENLKKPKQLWKSLKSLGLPSKKSAQSKICLEKNGKTTFNSKENAEIFKTFYENLSTDLVNKLPKSTNKFGMDSVRKYYNGLGIQSESFKFEPASETMVNLILESINPDKAVGVDNLAGRFLKDGSNILKGPITKLINLSISTAKFPDGCKIAKLKPLYKKGSSLEPKNYRPISLLPLVSKIFEKIIHDQTQKYLDEKKILYTYQSGFRPKHSTSTCLSLLQNKILNGFDNGQLTGMILIDLQKAFDTIDHNIFIQKLTCLGFSDDSVSWYQSYLQNRSFVVNIEKDYSTPASLLCGVPQGSILGPLIFLLYVNDMPQAMDCDLFLYADDSCLLYTAKNVKDIKEKLNANFNSLCDWFVENKLSIHFGEDKTKSILFGTGKRLKNLEEMDIRRGEIKIKQHSSVNYLGCTFDKSLSGVEMATKVTKTVSGRLRFLYRKQTFLTPYLRRLLCNALVQPHFDYACIAWYSNLGKKYTKKLQIMQNKCIRFCLNLGSRHHIGIDEFKKINWLPTRERFMQCVCVSAYRFVNNEAPAYMNDIYKLVSYYSYNTRKGIYRLTQPSKLRDSGLNSLSYIGPRQWNDLPNNLKLASNVSTFTHGIKDLFFSKLQRKEDDINVYY